MITLVEVGHGSIIDVYKRMGTTLSNLYLELTFEETRSERR